MLTLATVKVKKVKEITNEIVTSFGAHAQGEWQLIAPHAKFLYEVTRRLWVLSVQDEPACVIGLKHNTLLGAGTEIYFMLCKKFNSHMRPLSRFIRRALRRLVKVFGSVTVKIDQDFWVGEKFVKFFGFQCQGKVCSTQTASYNLFELRASWL